MIRVGFFLMALLLTTLSFGQIKQPVKWNMSEKQVSADEFDLIFTANMDPEWKIYSQFTEDGGPIPTTFEFDAGDHYTKVGDTKEEGKKKEGPDPLFDNIVVIKFMESPVVFTQRVKVKDFSKPVTGYLTFMTCDDESCLPPTDVDFSFSLKPKAAEKTAEVDETAANNESSKGEELTEEEKQVVKEAIAEQTEATVPEEQKTKVDAIEPVTTEIVPPSSIDNIDTGGGSEIEDPVQWSFSSKEVGDGEYDLVFVADLAPHWKLYSQHTDDDGPVPTTFEFTADNNYEKVGETKEEGKKKEGPDPLFGGVTVIKFIEGPVTFTQRVKVKDPNQAVKGYLTFMTCDDEKCLPPTDVDFAFNVATGKQEVVSIDSEPVIAPTINEGDYEAKTPNDYTFDKELDESVCSEKETEEQEATGLWLIFLLGFGGGLVALLTPCVFPMIPLTVTFFTKRSKDRATGIRNAFTYGGSIIVIYVALGLLITSVFGADALNLLSTNAWFNIFFAVLFIVFAISFFGYFEITLPSSWTNKSDQMADKGGLIGIFFMAFTLSLVSFSCTGPIIGTLLVETATGGGPTILGRIPAGPLMGMFGFSVALALPFGLFAAFPSWLNSLPRSGSWMNSVKVTLGFVEIALALKFLSVADLTEGWKILPYELFIAIWVACAVGLALYYFGLIRFPHDSPITKLSNSRKVLGVLSIALAVYFGMGFQYSSQSETFVTPNLLSGLAPPAGHSYIFPKSCPLNINCFKDFEEGMAYAKEQNKPILLDFTGHGCVNCRRMEDQVWGQDGVFDLINDEYVLISLYVDDRKKLKYPYMSTFSDRQMRTVGNKWADFQAIHFNRNSQPYYVLMSEDGKILNKPVAYTPDIEEYKGFLECGLERYEELKSVGAR